MKILVLSDTHAYLENARAVLARLQGKVDAVFHPVSYTHLDVYKRQWQGLPAQAKLPMQETAPKSWRRQSRCLSLIHIFHGPCRLFHL